MNIQRIRYKVLLALAIALSMGFAAITFFYTKTVEQQIVLQYRDTLHRLTETVIMNIETIMKEDHAEIMSDFSQRLKTMRGIIDFRIVRVDGHEAFADNKTIDAVNARLGEIAFSRRSGVAQAAKVFSTDDPGIQESLRTVEPLLVKIDDSDDGNSIYIFYDPIPNNPKCDRCHARTGKVRGMLQLTTSMAEAQRDIMKARMQSLVVLVASLVLTMATTGYILGRFIAKPIEDITAAMAQVTSGNFGYQMVSRRQDELGKMAGMFNKMVGDLQAAYLSMTKEREKLSSVIQGTQEAVVLTDAFGKVVLVNDAAEILLGKSVESIKTVGIVHLLDQPERFQAMLDDPDITKEPTLFEYKDRWLLTSATTIHDDEGMVVGSAALLRDVTLEQALLKELEHLSITDALTDVYNRRHLDATLKLELGRSKETGAPLSVIMIDVDHFKKFNDTYGHDQGDRVLKMAGQVMKATARPYDVPCRYGGEEFTVILPNTDGDGAMHFAERLRHNVESMTVDNMKVTISLGVACTATVAVASPDGLIEAADVAMYQSKEHGRNRATLATPEMLIVK